MNTIKTNFLIIGSGVAGLTLALKLPKESQVTLITKESVEESNSSYAQGGVAAVLNPQDSQEQHIEDTLIAGHHHNNLQAVKTLVTNVPKAIKFLKDLGVPFSEEQGREGGHRFNRISHVGDYTGRSIITHLIKAVKQQPNITIIEHCFALDLLTAENQCHGAMCLHQNQPLKILSGQTILATGGLGQAFNKTTNPKIATGDGIAMALRAGVKLKDLEYVQFHPTALDTDETPLFLVSEAVRGEGAILVNQHGEKFMEHAHHQKDLAPRDIVTAEIRKQKQKGNKVFLDITHQSQDFLKTRFPDIYAHLAKQNIHMEKDLIPVTPAAHYSCGGIAVDQHSQTNLKNLYAIGEVANTGLHGKNRLASNSLSEGIVFATLLAKEIPTTEPIEELKTKTPNITKLQAEQENLKLVKNTLQQK